MAKTQLHGQHQILINSVDRDRLVQNFLNGTDWDITGGAGNATITGLKDAVNASDAVTKSQLDSLAALVEQSIVLRGTLNAPADMTGTSTGNAYIDAGNGYSVGDKFLIGASGLLTVSDGTLAVNAGDSITILTDRANNADIVLADIHKTDNTESPDILRTGDVIDNLSSTDTDKPLSANQGKVVNDKVIAINNARLEPVRGEVLTGTVGSAVLSDLANVPYNAKVSLYIGGEYQSEGSGNDYTISGKTITLENPLWYAHNIRVDYEYVSPLTL